LSFSGSRRRQLYDARFGIRILSVEQRGVSHGAHEDAPAFIGDLGAERGSFIAVGAEETQLHQLVRTEEFLQLGEEFRSESATPDLQAIRERLSDSTQVGLLGAGEWEFVHQSANDANGRVWEDLNKELAVDSWGNSNAETGLFQERHYLSRSRLPDLAKG
jgi:hypothetical protein